MKDRGAALLTAVIAILILSLIAATFFSLSASRSRMETSEEKGLRAYYLAQAGIQYAVATTYDIQEIPVAPEVPVMVEDPFGEDYGGLFTVTWEQQEQEEGTNIIVKSVGEYRGVVRKIEAGFVLPLDSNDDNDNDNDDE